MIEIMEYLNTINTKQMNNKTRKQITNYWSFYDSKIIKKKKNKYQK